GWRWARSGEGAPRVTRLGVFGGTFDPPHLGHLIVAEAAREALRLDHVLFVPAGDPWHRRHIAVTAAPHRVAMTRLAIADNPAFSCSTIDVDRADPTYSVDTLRLVRQRYPDARLVFLMGQDALAQIGDWAQPAAIAELAEIVGLARPDAPTPDWTALETRIPHARSRVRLLATPLIGVSATLIRARIAAGQSVRYLVPSAVEAYIRAHSLYRGLDVGESEHSPSDR
ncbi:MAG: nicotinate-nucleotide adenylyltransferase, partial [Dehalococcoidia bacterium]|nr:nicotinate-nucleotide adenylyltransferase [Dehalococcoidia bacterium]